MRVSIVNYDAYDLFEGVTAYCSLIYDQLRTNLRDERSPHSIWTERDSTVRIRKLETRKMGEKLMRKIMNEFGQMTSTDYFDSQPI